MQYKGIILSIIGSLGFILSSLYAQESILPAGGDALGSGGSASYSVGQVGYTTIKGSNGSVAAGVQQPYEISVETGIEEALGIDLKVSAYPNPASHFLILSIDDSTPLSQEKLFGKTSIRYQLYDIKGQLLESKKPEGNQTSIIVEHLAPGTYFLKVIRGNKEIKTFKIIKN
jgi:hypothetical protein